MLEQFTGQQPIFQGALHRAHRIRRNEKISTVTVGNRDKARILESGLKVKEFEPSSATSPDGLLRLSHPEHIDLGIKYDPSTGIHGAWRARAHAAPPPTSEALDRPVFRTHRAKDANRERRETHRLLLITSWTSPHRCATEYELGATPTVHAAVRGAPPPRLARTLARAHPSRWISFRTARARLPRDTILTICRPAVSSHSPQAWTSSSCWSAPGSASRNAAASRRRSARPINSASRRHEVLPVQVRRHHPRQACAGRREVEGGVVTCIPIRRAFRYDSYEKKKKEERVV